MSIREALSEEMKKALRAGQKERLRALRMLMAELQVAETSGKDFEEVDVVKSHARELRKTVQEYERLGLTERVEALQRELAVVQEFLPQQMGREELERLITDLIQQHHYGPRDLGKVMKAVMAEHGDVVDGGLVRQIAAEKLM